MVYSQIKRSVVKLRKRQIGSLRSYCGRIREILMQMLDDKD